MSYDLCFLKILKTIKISSDTCRVRTYRVLSMPRENIGRLWTNNNELFINGKLITPSVEQILQAQYDGITVLTEHILSLK